MIDTLTPQLPALQVMLPLMAAPLCILLRRPTAAWLVFLLVSWGGLAISALLIMHVQATGPVSYAMGGWAPPLGIELRVDHLNAFVIGLVSLIAAVIAPYAKASVEREIDAERAYLFYTLMLLCLAGLLGIALTGDAFNLFVFLEISSLSTYALIAMGRKRRALLAAFQYLVLGTVGGTFILIGVGLLYAMTGTLNMQDLATRLPELQGTTTVKAALAFIVVGSSLKLALLPLHLWLPNAYTYAPSVVSTFIAATSTKVAAYALIRFIYTVFGAGFALDAMPLNEILIFLAVAAMLYGSIAAIFQSDVKRLLAWSSIAQIGYIVLGLALASATGLTASIVHLLNHGVIKAALFMAVGIMFWQTRSAQLSDLAGLGRTMPWASAAFVAAGLGLIGVPLTAGFISKWVLLSAVLERGQALLVAAILVSSLLAIVYIARVVETLYFRAPTPDSAPDSSPANKPPASMHLATWTLVLISIGIGVYSTPVVTYAQTAATQLLGGTP